MRTMISRGYARGSCRCGLTGTVARGAQCSIVPRTARRFQRTNTSLSPARASWLPCRSVGVRGSKLKSLARCPRLLDADRSQTHLAAVEVELTPNLRVNAFRAHDGRPLLRVVESRAHVGPPAAPPRGAAASHATAAAPRPHRGGPGARAAAARRVRAKNGFDEFLALLTGRRHAPRRVVGERRRAGGTLCNNHRAGGGGGRVCELFFWVCAARSRASDTQRSATNRRELNA